MKNKKPRINLYCLAVSVWSLIFFTLPVFAQDHSAHTAQPSTAASTAKPQAAEPVQDIPQVEISPEQQKLIGVKTVKVALRSVQKVIRTVGRIEADEGRQATINSKVEGWIEKLYVETTGSHVQKGQPIAEIYSPELVATQHEFLTALKWTKELVDAKAGSNQGGNPELSLMLSKDATAMLAASRQRLLLWDISEGQIKTIEESGKTIRTLTLYSPVNGFVTQKMVVVGMKVMPGEKLFDVADLSNLWVIADIYEAELVLIKVGDKAAITLAYLPGREISSQIDYIYPSIAADTRTVKVRLKITNHESKLKPQMFTNVEIKINLGKKLMIPESAVIDTGKAMVAYVDLGNGAFEPREIKGGLRTDGYIEVLRGLKPGEKVVSAANFLVDSEAQMKGIKPLPSRRLP